MLSIARSNAAALLAVLVSSLPLVAQFGGTGADGPFRPVANVTLDTTARPLGWDFTTIDIQAGVTVRLLGPYPAILRSRGSVRIAGSIDASVPYFEGTIPGPGGYRGGSNGNAGEGPCGGAPGAGTYSIGGFQGTPAGDGRHRDCYGQTIPFDLRGGSGGGGLTVYLLGRWSVHPGNAGGGVVVLLADGPLTVESTGSLTANGGFSVWGSQGLRGGAGAGGGLWIRTTSTLSVLGRIEAIGGMFSSANSDGYIRLDSFGATPTIGTPAWVRPTPTLISLPVLHAADPVVGGTLVTGVSSRPGDSAAVLLGFGLAPTPTPFGELALDLNYGVVLLGMAPETVGGLEPGVMITYPWPADPMLRGVSFHLQGIAAPTIGNGPVRLTNPVTITVR